MKIQIYLNKKSIDNAIKKLKKAKEQILNEMLKEFYKKCYDFFVGQANFHLLSSGIGDLVIAEIQSSWSYVNTTLGIKIINNAEKAVYVEFGVGVVGKEKPHPNSINTNYEYNKPSDKKLYDGSWKFKSYEDELDIPQEAIIAKDYVVDGKMRVLTLGTKGVWYAYNALEDLRIEIPKIWENIKIKYWG